MWHDSILETIGNTPLVRLNRVVAGSPCTVLAKVEYFNPGLSVKDRIGLSMIKAAEEAGELKPGGTIVEGTSGNTGTGLALVAIAKGYRCIFTTTDKQSQEKVDVLRAMGAEVLVCPTNVAPDDPRSYYSTARRLADEIPGAVYLNQYDNPANAKAHYESTGPELWEQTEGKITHFIATAGTGGTISGTARYLKEKNPDIKVIGVDTFGSVYHKYFFTREFDESEIYPYVTEGVGEDILAGNMDFDAIDDFMRATDKENMLMTRRLAREEGLFVGQSCGLAVAGTLKWIEANRASLSENDLIVVLLPDSGFRYLSKTYNDTWMRNNGFLAERPELRASQIGMRAALQSVGPGETLGTAADMMVEGGVSQIPVLEGDEVVGSLTDNDVLSRLIREPDARDHLIGENMGPPLPVVGPETPLEGLTRHLSTPPGAVLVRHDASWQIITRSDVIEALSQQTTSNA